MYIPNAFEITDEAVIEEFIKANNFATVVTQGSEYPIATHIPVELEINPENRKVLWGHISKANKQTEILCSSPNVLVIFLSPIHHYISSSWYGHPNASTWNYMSVHISGKLTVMKERKTVVESLRRLTDKYEKEQLHPICFDSLHKSVYRQISGITPFEIEIHKIEAAFKLSQNRNNEDFSNIIRQLRLKNTPQALWMADCMEKTRKAGK